VVATTPTIKSIKMFRNLTKELLFLQKQLLYRMYISQIRYSLVVILELNNVSEIQYKDMMIDR